MNKLDQTAGNPRRITHAARTHAAAPSSPNIKKRKNKLSLRHEVSIQPRLKTRSQSCPVKRPLKAYLHLWSHFISSHLTSPHLI